MSAAWFCSTFLLGVVASFMGVSARPTLGRTLPVFWAPVLDEVFSIVPVKAVEAAVRSKTVLVFFVFFNFLSNCWNANLSWRIYVAIFLCNCSYTSVAKG